MTSAKTGDGQPRIPLGLIIGLALLGVVLLIGAVLGVAFFVRWQRSKAVAQPKVEAYHVDEASLPPQSNTRAVPLKSMGGLTITSPTSSKREPPLPGEPVVSSSKEHVASATAPIPSKSPLVSSPLLPTRQTTQPSVPPVPIPQATSTDAIPPPTLTRDPSSTPHPAGVSPALSTPVTGTLPSTAQFSQVAASESNTVVLRSEIEGLREQVRLLQLREATRPRDSEFQSYEPPPQYSPRRPGYRSDGDDDD